MNFRIALLAALSTTLVACAVAPHDDRDSPSGGVTILHLNDTYRVDAVEDGNRGGFGRVATLVRDLQAEGRDVRITHGGDFLFPSLESQLWAGEQMVEAMNFLDDLAPMYVVPGNHEFDSRTASVVIDRVRQSRFDWLADNLAFNTGDADVDEKLQSGFTFTAGGRKFGVIALSVQPEHGGNQRDYTPFSGSYLENAERVIREFEADDVDMIFGLTHLHLFSDVALARLKQRHPKFEFIVGGHEHEVQFSAGDRNNATVMKGASNARTIWRIDIDFTGDSPRVQNSKIEVDNSIAGDADYQLIADKWRARLLELIPFLPSRIGEAAVPLDGREVAVRGGDSNWGMFIADQMRTAFGEAADFSFVNGGTLRIDDYIADDVTFEDIGRTFGFSSFLRHLTMDGADFRQMLEAGYRGTGLGKGYFPQISGFRVCVDHARPNGERIVQMQVPAENGTWQSIDPDRAYTAVVGDYIYRGGDGYDFSAARDVSLPGSELKYLVLDAVVRAQAGGEKIGFELTPDKTRFMLLPAGADTCYP